MWLVFARVSCCCCLSSCCAAVPCALPCVWGPVLKVPSGIFCSCVIWNKMLLVHVLTTAAMIKNCKCLVRKQKVGGGGGDAPNCHALTSVTGTCSFSDVLNCFFVSSCCCCCCCCLAWGGVIFVCVWCWFLGWGSYTYNFPLKIQFVPCCSHCCADL